MFYKNISYTAKTFYGVTFKPGEIKEVKGHINDKLFIRVDKPQTTLKSIQQKPSPEPKDSPEPKSIDKPESPKTQDQPVDDKPSEVTEAKVDEKPGKGKKS